MADLIKNIQKSLEFKNLVTSRWTVAIILTFLVFLIYYGFIILIGVSKETLAYRIGEVTTLGIPMAAGVIVSSFILTLVYVAWANSKYDIMVSSLVQKLQQKRK